MTMQWSYMLEKWVTDFRAESSAGHCASYIPALAEADPSQLGICIYDSEGQVLRAGEWDVPFTMQSISKVISFMAACITRGIDQVLKRVDVEPTGDAFNSIVRLETNRPGKPFNPMINAGAITVASLLPGTRPEDKIETLLQFLAKLTGKQFFINEQVYRSEWETAHRNRALAYYLKDMGYLDSSVEDALEVYIKQCSIEVNADHLAEISLILAHDGYHPVRQESYIPKQVARITKALMLTCGMYNASGKFAAFVGLPAKSGVSGGIMACVPPRYGQSRMPLQAGGGIGIYGPAIDEYGNSKAGVALLQHIAQEWDLSIF